jgi:hypothetical protein
MPAPNNARHVTMPARHLRVEINVDHI